MHSFKEENDRYLLVSDELFTFYMLVLTWSFYPAVHAQFPAQHLGVVVATTWAV